MKKLGRQITASDNLYQFKRGGRITLPFKADVSGDLSDIKAITTDVFDTFMLRKPVSEVKRHTQISALILKALKAEGFIAETSDLTADVLRWTRRKAQFLAFRARERQGYDQEVRLADIIRRQLKILALPKEAYDCFINAELEVERECLTPNIAVLEWFKAQREIGRPIYAISDTMLSNQALIKLILDVVGYIPVDRVFSSCELQASKRAGDVYDVILDQMGLAAKYVLHIGDDYFADVKMAREKEFNAVHIPRSKPFITRRRLDGLLHVTQRTLFGKTHRITPHNISTKSYGQDILGPIVLEYALLSWLYLDELRKEDNACVLFCARGGLLMRQVHEIVQKKLGLELQVPLRDFMVSRLVAARLALEKKKPSAIDEICREADDSLLDETMERMAGQSLSLSEEWKVATNKNSVLAFLDHQDSKEFRQLLAAQNLLFRQHISEIIGNSKRVILADTGLYGSTLRLLEDGMPELKWEALMLARCNYKGLSEDHFSRATGLWVERNKYKAFDNRSSILRFWHLAEHLFEPNLKSVKSFVLKDGKAVSNLETDGWQQTLADNNNELFKGVVAHLEELSPERMVAEIGSIDRAWKSISKSITLPKLVDIECLNVGERSRDFGREEKINFELEKPVTDLNNKIRQVRGALWKPGKVVQLFPSTHRIINSVVHSIYILRSWKVFKIVRMGSGK